MAHAEIRGGDATQAWAGAAESRQVLSGGRRIWKGFVGEVVFEIPSEQGRYLFLRRDRHVQRPRGFRPRCGEA